MNIYFIATFVLATFLFLYRVMYLVFYPTEYNIPRLVRAWIVWVSFVSVLVLSHLLGFWK